LLHCTALCWWVHGVGGRLDEWMDKLMNKWMQEYRKNETGEACWAYRGEKRRIQRYVGITEEKRQLGRPRRRWVDNILMDLQEAGCGCMNCIELAQDRDKWRALVKAGIEHSGSLKCGEFLDYLKTGQLFKDSAPLSK
jgi:hypothetical protein